MELQSACAFIQKHSPSAFFRPQFHPVTKLKNEKPSFQIELKSILPNLKKREVIILAANSNSNSSRKLAFRVNAINNSEPCRGKSGSVSFANITYQSIEESQLVSAPFKEDSGSLLWTLAPVALIASLILPQFFIVTAVEIFLENEVVAELISSFSTEVAFYAGLAIFLRVTDHVQKPFLQFSAKRWSLITGLRGYLTSAFFTMGIKVFVPIFAAYVTWPMLGLPALVSVAPFLFGCLVQYLFERGLEKKGSSCWPLVPIIFEERKLLYFDHVYRIYQLSRASSFIEKLTYSMRDSSASPPVTDLISMIVTFRVLGLVCLWSLLTFLLRLFPSRPVAENY